MSRHELEQRDKAIAEGQLEIAIGWDRPLNTYFVQVLDPTYDEEDARFEVLWRGNRFGEILSTDEAIAMITPWAIIPADLRAALIADHDTAA